MYNLPENIKDFRLMRQLSQKDLAVKLQRSVGTIANWEKGLNSPPVEVVLDLCEALQTNPNELLGWSESEELKAFKQEHAAILTKIEELNKQKAAIDDTLKLYASYMAAFKKNTDNKPEPGVDFVYNQGDKKMVVETMRLNK